MQTQAFNLDTLLKGDASGQRRPGQIRGPTPTPTNESRTSIARLGAAKLADSAGDAGTSAAGPSTVTDACPKPYQADGSGDSDDTTANKSKVTSYKVEVAAPKEDKKKPKAKAKGKKKQKKTETDADSAEDAAGGRDEDDDEEDAEPPRKKPASRTSGHRLSMSCGQPILRR